VVYCIYSISQGSNHTFIYFTRVMLRNNIYFFFFFKKNSSKKKVLLFNISHFIDVGIDN
jgi:hypothetical protein